MVPELLAADIQPGTLPVPTKQNLADAATRSGRTRAAPLREPPAWMAALDEVGIGRGDYCVDGCAGGGGGYDVAGAGGATGMIGAAP